MRDGIGVSFKRTSFQALFVTGCVFAHKLRELKMASSPQSLCDSDVMIEIEHCLRYSVYSIIGVAINIDNAQHPLSKRSHWCLPRSASHCIYLLLK
jgi:hypothetical protein